MIKSTTPNKRYDLIVIGSGPAGIHAAVQAAKLKKKVAIVEKNPNRLGGAWIHTGTIPSKTMREVLETIHSIHSHVGSKWVNRIIHDLSSTRLRERAKEVSLKEEKLIEKHLRNNGIDILRGYGILENRYTVRVIPQDEEAYLVEGDHLLVATGSKPRRPPEIPFDGWRVVDSDEILKMETIPQSILVFGAGVIGCEYACIFGALGVETTVVDSRSVMMQSLDREISLGLKKSMEALGIKFKLGYQLDRLEIKGPNIISHFPSEAIETELFFFAAGRKSCTDRIGLDKLGIEMNDRGAIEVNDNFQTNVPNIYAAGDAIGPPALASTSIEQGRIAVCHAFQSSNRKFPPVFPVGVYTIPELSSVGKSEEQLKTEGADFVIGRAEYDEVARGYIRGDSHGLVKLIACRKTQQILGVHIVGADAANLIHIGQCAMLTQMPLQDMVNRIIFNYPTLAEVYRIAAFNALNQIFPSGIFKDPPSNDDVA